MILFSILLLLLPAMTVSAPISPPSLSLLDTFVDTGDEPFIDYAPLPSLDFSGSGRGYLNNVTWTAQAFNLTSQVWLEEGDWGSTWSDNSQQWWHHMYIITPSTLEEEVRQSEEGSNELARLSQTQINLIHNPNYFRDSLCSSQNLEPSYEQFAHLYITGGKNTDVPSGTSEDIIACADLAMGMKQRVVVLFQVPNFPIWINTDEGPTELLGEDALLANTFVHYMDHVKKGGDPQSLPDASFVVLLPMVKSGFAAMSAAEDFLGASKVKWTVSGASKRGWTTWLVGAVDQARPIEEQRVKGIVPIVLNGLYFEKTLKHQYRCYGGWSWTMAAFIDTGFTARIDSEEIQYLWDLIDPFTYIPRFVDLPKLAMSMAGDEFFVLDSSRYWMERMKEEGGEVHNSLHPDAGHSSVTALPSLIPSLAGFVSNVAAGRKNPNVDWEMNYDSASIILTIPEEYADLERTVQLWKSHTCNKLGDHRPARRDFRMIDYDMASFGECACGFKIDDDMCFNLRASIWKNEILSEENGNTNTYTVDMTEEVPPKWENRWLGFFITVTFHGAAGVEGAERVEGAEGMEVEGVLPKVEPGDLRLSSQAMILPDYAPYDCEGEECLGNVL